MSVSSTLAGLFPPKGQQIWNEELLWQPIPIHGKPTEYGELLPNIYNCPNYERHYNRTKNSKHFMKINRKYKQIFADLSVKTGMEIKGIDDVSNIRDVLYVYENYNKTYLPSWISKVNRETVDKLSGIYLESKSYTKALKKFLVGPFFHSLNSFFEDATNNTDHKKLLVVSTHGSFLVPVLDSLGVYDFFPPDFSAAIIFELRRDNDDYFVDIFYRMFNGNRQLHVKSCGNICKFSTLKKALKRYSWDYRTWKKSCGQKHK